MKSRLFFLWFRMGMKEARAMKTDSQGVIPSSDLGKGWGKFYVDVEFLPPFFYSNTFLVFGIVDVSLLSGLLCGMRNIHLSFSRNDETLHFRVIPRVSTNIR